MGRTIRTRAAAAEDHNQPGLRKIEELKASCGENFVDTLCKLAVHLTNKPSTDLNVIAQKIEVWRYIVNEDAANYATASVDEALTLSIMDDVRRLTR